MKAVTVRATADVNNLMKKPELIRPAAAEVPVKTLFGDNSATPVASPAPTVASSQAATSKCVLVELGGGICLASSLRVGFPDLTMFLEQPGQDLCHSDCTLDWFGGLAGSGQSLTG